jgi:hypothetical protein
MAFSLYENWDLVTPPAIPANWNNHVAMSTSSSKKYTGSNSLTLTTGSGAKYYATYGVPDPGGGAAVDITSLIYFDSSITTGDYYAGPTFRCSAATMDNTSTSCYWVYLWYNPAPGSTALRFTKIVNGTVTFLNTTYISTGELARGVWYSIRILSYGSNLFSVSLARSSDGYTLSPSGTFGSSPSVAIPSLTASDITSGSYYGLCANASTATAQIFMDDLLVNASGVLAPPPKSPLVVPIPFQYYRPD